MGTSYVNLGEHSFRGASGEAVGQQTSLQKDNELFNFFLVEVDKE